ncbi:MULTISPECIES: DUF58 domain-containing protein [Methylosinus]|uniref:DUF58 domain-containing protein n=1 Tax=Methylosinus trichosporium (strain ATCC 35070 / NCIMB 11131 / UNIQEM 75 / OB3b) TaxID=595536 RepID=A0A2D2D605_METT3|nr:MULTISPECIES: DUF58 domain-containing protein [Methylosinus]ATQ70402.1 DUF58 domain-containing protein [Methylosinus trichosporium OB3b]OBS52336.1 MxaS protein [Methylosinus sp. 3S-1]
MTAPQDIAYRPRGRFLSNRIGAHASSEVGGFGVFRDQTPFLRHPDARRIDLRATLRDPFGETYVRRFEQRQAIDVYAIVDLSASMGFGAKHDIAADLVASLAFSANRIGDRFGLIGCDRALRQELLFPASASRPLALRAADSLRAARASGDGAQGVLDAAAALGAARRLVFLISDFRWPAALIDRAFAAFSPHDAIPIAIVDSSEETPPRWGLLELVDAETGARRLEVMRPALQARWIDDERRRFAEIARLANGRARPPIILRDRFDALELGRGLTAA